MIECRRELYQIFYPVKKFDDPVKAFSDYYCTPEYLKNLSEIQAQYFSAAAYLTSPLPSELPDPELSSVESESEPFSIEDAKTESNQNHCIQEKWFEPFSQDTLFWCLFFHIYGQGEYLEIHKNYGKRELEEKQKIVEFYTGKDGKKNAASLKCGNQKLTLADIQETLSGLMVNKKTHILELFAMANYYKVGVVLIDPRNKTCVELIPENVQTDKMYKIYYNTDTTIPGKWRTREQEIDSDNDYYRLEQWNKPLKAVSSYKLPELQEIAQRLNIDIHLKKQELYDKLAQTIVWKN